MRLEGIQASKIADISNGQALWLTQVKDSNAVQVRLVDTGEVFHIGARGAITELTKKKDSDSDTEPKDAQKKSQGEFLPLFQR